MPLATTCLLLSSVTYKRRSQTLISQFIDDGKGVSFDSSYLLTVRPRRELVGWCNLGTIYNKGVLVC